MRKCTKFHRTVKHPRDQAWRTSRVWTTMVACLFSCSRNRRCFCPSPCLKNSKVEVKEVFQFSWWRGCRALPLASVMPKFVPPPPPKKKNPMGTTEFIKNFINEKLNDLNLNKQKLLTVPDYQLRWL